MRLPNRSPNQPRSELAAALAACRDAIIAIALMSGMSNILMLTGAMFMLEIYDRVLPSRSVPTLVGLVILAGGLVHGAGADRPDPRTHPGADRRQSRRGAQRPRLRDDRAAAAEDRRPQRWSAAAARSRQRALVFVRPRSHRAFRFAVAADLSRRSASRSIPISAWPRFSAPSFSAC